MLKNIKWEYYNFYYKNATIFLLNDANNEINEKLILQLINANSYKLIAAW